MNENEKENEEGWGVREGERGVVYLLGELMPFGELFAWRAYHLFPMCAS